MLFSIDKNKSLAILQATGAIFMLLAPLIADLFCRRAGVYVAFLTVLIVFLLRMKRTERFYFSLTTIGIAVFSVYLIISSIWATNKEGHLLYIIEMMGIALFFSLAIDYLREGNRENLARRMMYLIFSGGTLCALRNIIYWLFYIIPIAGKASFSQGLKSSDFLSVCMILCIFCALTLFKKNTSLKKRVIILSLLLMGFVFIMAKSLIGWLFLLLTIIMLVSKKYYEKLFMPIGVASIFVFAGVIAIVASLFEWGRAFSELFSFALSHPFGCGGGIMTSQALFAAIPYKDNAAGLLATIFAQSGFIGLIFCLVLVIRSIMLFIRLKTWESFFLSLLTVMMMALPSFSYVSILFWSALFAYNEEMAGLSFGKLPKSKTIGKIVYTLLIICVISSLLCAEAFIRLCADKKMENEDYLSAYSLYRASAAMNITDSESCRLAAKALRKSSDINLQRDEAIALIDKAIKRDFNNMENIVEKAKIYNACGEYDLGAQQYRYAAGKALSKDRYNLELVKTLYKIVKKHPKGSSETKRAYEEILLLAKETENLDYRKSINDIADKAHTFTKEELKSETID